MVSENPLNSGATRTTTSENVSYREIQHFQQVWIWIVVLAIMGAIWYIFVRQVVFGIPVSDGSTPNKLVIVFWIMFGILLPLFSLYARLIIELRNEGIHIRFLPFHLKFRVIPFSEIAKCWARDYRPILEFGGWGIRKTARGMGLAYTIMGTRGIQLVMKSGQMILIGSQHADALSRMITASMDTDPEEEAGS